jgi:hypothetical protein
MLPGISSNSTAADLIKSLDALSGVLKDTVTQSQEMADKVLKLSVRQNIQDSMIGVRIDTSA